MSPHQESKERCETCGKLPCRFDYGQFICSACDDKGCHGCPPTCPSTDEEGKATEILEFLRDTQRFVSADIQKSLDSHRDYITKALTQSKLSGLKMGLVAVSRVEYIGSEPALDVVLRILKELNTEITKLEGIKNQKL